MNYLRKLVNDSISLIILSLGGNIFFYLRFEEVRKYSSVQVRDPQGVLYVSPPGHQPAMAVAFTQHSTPEVLAFLFQKLGAVFRPNKTAAPSSAETVTSTGSMMLSPLPAAPIAIHYTLLTISLVQLTFSVAPPAVKEPPLMSAATQTSSGSSYLQSLSVALTATRMRALINRLVKDYYSAPVPSIMAAGCDRDDNVGDLNELDSA